MTQSTTTETCSTCGGDLIAKDGQVYCPACLLQQGMQESTFGGNPALRNWTPPELDQLVQRFPNLEVESLLGQGGMGAVYKVRQKELDRPAALKILPEAVASDPSFTERFLREARLLASLSHPHIVTVYEFGERDGLYFILMEFVDGVTLRQASLADPIKRLAPAEALEVVGQLCDALQFAHDEGVVHRDIKPENILIDKRGRVKIADFGLARLLGKPADLPTLTRTHQLMGTPTYMAPEQIEGQPVIDHRADIYSLGVVFYELLTGELPLGRFQPPSEKVQLDARLDEVVFRTLEKEPNRRYQKASDVRTDMNAIHAARAAMNVNTDAASTSETTRTIIRWLIVCWAFIGTSAALYFWELADTPQQVAIGIAVAAIVAVLLQVFKKPERRWVWPRFATGFLLGIALPAVFVLGAISKMVQRLEYERYVAQTQANTFSERVADLDWKLQQANQKLSMEGGDDMDSMMGGGGYGMSAGEEYESGGMGMEAGGGGMGMGGPGMDSYDAGMGMGASGMGGGYESGYGGMEMGDMGFGYNPGPAVFIKDNKAWLSSLVKGFSDDERDTVNTILTDVHHKYLGLETEYSKITVGRDDSVTTSIYYFPHAWERLENELWTRLDEAVDVKQQRTLRRRIKPEYLRDAEHAMPGLLGWRPSVSSLAKPGEFAPVDATVRLRRVGKWAEAEIAGDPGNKPARVIPSSPKLPEELQRFDHENTPQLAIRNARSAYVREDWKTLVDQFTPLGRFDVWAGLNHSLPNDPQIKKVISQVFRTELAHPTMTAIGPNPQLPIVVASGATTRGELTRAAAVETATSFTGGLLNHPSYDGRVAELRTHLQLFQTGTTEYLLLHAMLVNQALGKPPLPIFDGDDTELNIDMLEGDSARGSLRIGAASMIPMSFQLVDNNWKIDGILTPESSLLMHDPEPDAFEETAEAADASSDAAEPDAP